MTNPACCEQPAKWVHISHRLEYWFCEKCKKEVQEKKTPETSNDDNNIWYPGLPGFTPRGAGSLGIQPVTPQPLVLGQTAQFTNGIDTPCYNNYIHCWTGKASYDMGVACTCGQRVKALPPPLTHSPPIPLDPICEMPIFDDTTPCSDAANVHFWTSRRRYDVGLPCNCGLRVK